jgi:hypothetical protein
VTRLATMVQALIVVMVVVLVSQGPIWLPAATYLEGLASPGGPGKGCGGPTNNPVIRRKRPRLAPDERQLPSSLNQFFEATAPGERYGQTQFFHSWTRSNR